MTVTLHHGDCIDVMQSFPDHSFDAIIADLPYGTTACKWDSVIPFEPLWEQYKRLAKKRAAIVLFGSQPFTSALVMSNVGWFKYCWAWDKVLPTGHLDAQKKPLKYHEDIAVFGCSFPKFNPQKWEGMPNHTRKASLEKRNGIYNDYHETESDTSGLKYPKSIISISKDHSSVTVHPTQKPVALLEYLIRTYTNPGDTVLDNTMGSGTTMVACVNTGRNGVGIELYPLPGKPIHKTDNPDYFGIAQARVDEALAMPEQLELL